MVLGLAAGWALGQEKKGAEAKAPEPQAQAESPALSGTGVAPHIDRADTAWVLVATGLVLLMVPGLALFYGGMVRRKNILGTMMHSMVALSLVGIQWLLIGYCLAFGKSQGGWIGWDPDLIGLAGKDPTSRFAGTHIPVYVHCMFQGMFAIITPALISGAIAERVRFGPYCVFLLLWATLVYDPLAHWVWAVKENPTQRSGDPLTTDAVGLLGDPARVGAIDFAGGTVVHIAAGFSALAAIVILRKRFGYPEHAMHPNSMVLTLLGAGLLWFGWFGFNGGSALGSGALAGMALTATQVAAAAAGLSWLAIEWLHRGKPTALGLASGVVAGLVAVTPASGFVGPLSALYIGLAAGAVCYGAVALAKPRLGYDDSLDAFGIHGIGGFLGALLTGVLANVGAWQMANGYSGTVSLGQLPGGGTAAQFKAQLLAAVVAAGYAFVMTLVLVKLIDLTLGFTLDPRSESEGLDRSAHGEVGFDLGPALQEAPGAPPHEPRPASVPPDGKRYFTVVVEGPPPKELMQVWSQLCGAAGTPPADFRTLYTHVTTVRGNRFHFRGGDPQTMRATLQRLFEDRLGGSALRTHVEQG
jgi:ammonium transporter